MDEASTNVELEELYVHGGAFVSDIEKGKTEIPPKGAGKKESRKEPGMIEISLEGKGYKKEIEAEIEAKKEAEGFEVGD